MEAKPLRTVPASHNTSGGGPQKKIDMEHKMEGRVVDGRKRVFMVKEENNISSPNSVELHLGLDASHSAPQEINHVITEAQRCELHHQVFIFNHLAYNLPPPPPPYHLVQFPSNMSEYSFLGFDHGSMVDPEPHRCRRTDGKKWRCGKNVVPNQKYCERHMHRGRNRSRKPVETSQVNSPLATKPCSKSHTKPSSKTQFEMSSPNLMAIPHNDTSSTLSRSLGVTNCSSANNRSKNSAGYADYSMSFSSTSAVSSGTTLATPVAPKMAAFSSATSVVASDSKSCLNICQKDNQSKSCISNNIGVKSGGKGSTVGDTNTKGNTKGISTGLGFSPTSVLQVSVSGCNASYLNEGTNIEAASGRCRRTDGKKWQCKSAVLPGQKYCATHMHRGAKKRLTSHEPAATATSSAVTVARLPYSSATTNIQKAHCAIPNTNLSMSVPASEAFIQCNEKSQSSSDTDTTISDTLNEHSYASF